MQLFWRPFISRFVPRSTKRSKHPRNMTGCDGLALHDARPWVVAGQHVGRYEPASILAALPGFGGLDPALLTGKTIRQIDAQTIASGVSVGGFFVVADAAAALLFDDPGTARVWANNLKQVNTEIAPSLTYVASGHSSVSLLKLT